MEVKITFAEDVTDDFAMVHGTTDPVALISGEVYESGKKLLDIEETLHMLYGQWRSFVGDAPSAYHVALQEAIDNKINV